MNVEATEAELHYAAEALKLAAILDDRAPHADRARIAAWAEQIHRHRLEREDLLDGLQVFYDSPSDRPIAIGDLIHHARQIRRDRNEREETAQRDARREVADAKALDDITATAITGPTRNRTERLIKAEIALQCCNGKRESQQAIREYFAAKAPNGDQS